MKYTCDNCYENIKEGELLKAPHPFIEGDNIYGCPNCKEIDKISEACDEPDCWRPASCGTPTKDGYRRTCGIHKPLDTP